MDQNFQVPIGIVWQSLHYIRLIYSGLTCAKPLYMVCKTAKTRNRKQMNVKKRCFQAILITTSV